MNGSPFERKLAKNEVVFRQHNEKVQRGFDELDAISKSEGYGPYHYDKKMTLQFYCECSDEKCFSKIPVRLDHYTSIHKNRNRFIVLSGHEVQEVETVVKQTDNYVVVEKHQDSPPKADQLYTTSK